MSRLEPTNEASAMQKEISAIAEQGGGTTKVEQLIQQYCPDGVEYKRLGDICKLARGTRVVKKDLSINGAYPVYQNSLKPLGYYDQFNRAEETTFIICAGAAGDIGYSKVKFWSADDCFSVICPDTISNRYVFYCLLSQQNRIYSQVRKASIPRLSHSAVEALYIPVPPLPVQEEIVRILDNFAELQAELQKRLQQYNYYRDKLLSFNELNRGAKRKR